MLKYALIAGLLFTGAPAFADAYTDKVNAVGIDAAGPRPRPANNTANSVPNPNTRNALAVAKAKGWRVQPTSTGYIINGKFYPRDSGSPSSVSTPTKTQGGVTTSCHGSGCRG